MTHRGLETTDTTTRLKTKMRASGSDPSKSVQTVRTIRTSRTTLLIGGKPNDGQEGGDEIVQVVFDERAGTHGI